MKPHFAMFFCSHDRETSRPHGPDACWPLTALKARVGRVLPRRELRETGADFLDGLLSGIERKTGWLMAEQSGAE
ncbi:hypothetical protein NKH48_35590, partial [Mesorhizobium sp. M1233]